MTFISIFKQQFHPKGDSLDYPAYRDTPAKDDTGVYKASEIRLANNSLQKLISSAPLFTRIILFEGIIIDWRLHPEGGVLVIDEHGDCYHNNAKTHFEFVDGTPVMDSTKRGRRMIEKGGKIFASHNVIFEGFFEEWAPNLNGGGVIVKQGNTLCLIVF